MKIVHCIFSLNIGGAESLLIDILNEQAKTENVILIILNNSFTPSLLNKINSQVKVVCINRKQGSRNLLPILRFNILLLLYNPDIIHIHNIAIRQLIIIPNTNIVFTAHCLGIRSKYLNKVNKIIAISDSVKADILNHCNSQVVAIPNGINIDKIIYKRGKHDEHIFKIVQVGRLDKDNKGQDILIEALRILINKGYHNILIDFIGTGDSFDYLRNLANKLNVIQNINFLGARDRDYIYEHLSEYDLMCHPARHEGFGLVIAEAMAAGLPVLVSSDDGPYEVIDGGKYGNYFEKENIKACADSIEVIMKNYDKALNKAKIARNYVIEKYSIQNMVVNYLKAYNNENFD